MLLAVLVSTAFADEGDWRTSWDGTLYGYANRQSLRSDSVLNPANQIARLAPSSTTLESRFNFKAENEALRLTLRPIVLAQKSNQTGVREAYWSQWQLRLRASEALNLAAGREVLNWGVAQFRSPSSPFYFDNGRANPMRELSGVDALKLSWNPDLQHTLMLARINASGHVAQNTWRDSWLVKLDQRGERWSAGMVVLKTAQRGAFLATQGQFSLNDAWLMYGELASSTRINSLNSLPDSTQPFTISSESARKLTGLAGLAYTLENGQSLNAEYLHDAHGYTAAEEGAYFQRAAASHQNAGLALGLAPQLLGRDFLHLVWQTNLMESSRYARLMLTHSLTDGGDELTGYGEISVSERVSAYLLAALNAGSARQEFSSLSRNSVTLGVKVALP